MSDHPDCPRSARPGAGSPEWRTASIRTPDEVIRAVPYLLGFHPRESLVLLALAGSVASLRFLALPKRGAA